MTNKSRLLFTLLALSLTTAVMAQQEKIGKIPVKFGKVTPEDFNVNPPSPDSAAGAVIVADYGYSHFEGNPKGWFTLVYKHSCRIKILKKDAFDAGTITIPLYVSGRDVETVQGLHASTYTLEGGKVVETKLDDKSIFTTQLDKNHIEKKFSFPALKEGCIIEYTYTQESPFLFNLQSWAFQGGYPCRWSEYEVEMPNFFHYVTLAHGYVPFDINTTDSKTMTFRLTIPGGAERSEAYSFEDNVVTHRWVMRNVPSLKEEPFTTTVGNYMARLEFQLAQYNFPNGYIQDIMGNWTGLSKSLLESDDFGADLSRGNGWMDQEMAGILKAANKPQEKAQRIFAFIRDNFTCTSHSRLYMDNNLKTTYKNRSGSEAELNLLLDAMLVHAKIAAKPVILSTRSNGFPNELYPLVSRFNYVITQAVIDSSVYYLDASETWLGFGKLPERCYNGYARVLDKENSSAVSLDADALQENKMTLVILTADDNGHVSGRFQTTPGFTEACDIRSKVKKSGRGDYFKGIQAGYSQGVAVEDFEIDSLLLPEEPLALSYGVTVTPDPAGDIFYFNPMLGEVLKQNPFMAAERKYPVEMPYAMDEMYNLTMDIPAGYVVDELPKSAKVVFNDDQGFFEYLIVKNETSIQFRSRIKLKQANFKPEDYAPLRDFFGYVVKKESEQIVFKKKKA